MADVMKQIARLAALAAQRPAPAPLDSRSVMLRLRGLPPPMADDGVLALPFGYYAGASAAAAAVAAVVGALAVSAWQEMDNPFTGVETLLDLTEYVI